MSIMISTPNNIPIGRLTQLDLMSLLGRHGYALRYQRVQRLGGGWSVNHKDMIYKHAFDELLRRGASQKIAGDYAARAAFLWARGRTLDQALKMAYSEARPSIRQLNDKRSKRARLSA